MTRALSLALFTGTAAFSDQVPHQGLALGGFEPGLPTNALRIEGRQTRTWENPRDGECVAMELSGGALLNFAFL
jgi:hypothetical protein